MKKFLYLVQIILILFPLQVVLLNKIKALDIGPWEDLNFDETLTEQEQEYSQNKKIIITPVFYPLGESVNIDEWIQSLYYYSVARLGYADMPFHYIVDSNGNIYKTNKGGDEAKIDISETDSDSIIIAYLAEPDDSDFSDQAKTSLNQLALQIANMNSIEYTEISVSNIRFKLNNSTKLAELELREITGMWQVSFDSIKSYVKANYKPVAKEYGVKVVGIKAPSGELNPGETAIVEITIQNTGQYSLYADSDSMLLATKADGKASKFFINEIWSSQSQIAVMPSDEVLRPGSEATYQMKFKVPLFFGAQKEDFILKDGLGKELQTTDFSVTLNVGKLSETVVEIIDTETGYLNVRETASGSSRIIAKVSPGERFIQKDTSQYGYVQIELSNGELGWVSQKYVKVVN